MGKSYELLNSIGYRNVQRHVHSQSLTFDLVGQVLVSHDGSLWDQVDQTQTLDVCIYICICVYVCIGFLNLYILSPYGVLALVAG
jgi:hypothetical protein